LAKVYTGGNKQSGQQQNQAVNAVSIFFDLEPVKNVKETNPYYGNKPQLTNSSLVSVYNDLESEIKIRHYSPRTLKTYTGWARQLQNFTKSPLDF